jgi:hypothetical protein
MSTINVLFEYQPRFVLSEHLAFETYRLAGVPTPLSGHWRTWYNGRPVGYHLFVEQPNSSFLRRVQRDPDGDLFKLIWYGGDLIGQHEKKNNPESGHAQLVETVEALNQTPASKRWTEIERRFQVAEFVNYYAVSMLIQNWDGFFNNYFLYRSPGTNGTWEIIPWDEDKTWGDYDGASPQYDWYSMPLTYGMAGDKPKMKLSERFLGQNGSAWRTDVVAPGGVVFRAAARRPRVSETLQNPAQGTARDRVHPGKDGTAHRPPGARPGTRDPLPGGNLDRPATGRTRSPTQPHPRLPEPRASVAAGVSPAVEGGVSPPGNRLPPVHGP